MTTTIAQLDPEANLTQVLQWADNNAPRLQKLIKGKNDWYVNNVTDFTKRWYQDVFNIDSLNYFGCVIWARILGIQININVPGENAKPWGFGDPDEPNDNQPNENFEAANFTAKNGVTVALTIEEVRLLLKLQYLKLTSYPSPVYINAMLNAAFGYRQAHIIDPRDMSYVLFVFRNEPGDSVRLMFDHFDLLPRPSGVGVQIRVDRESVFGFGPFEESDNRNFEHSNFVTEIYG